MDHEIYYLHVIYAHETELLHVHMYVEHRVSSRSESRTAGFFIFTLICTLTDIRNNPISTRTKIDTHLVLTERARRAYTRVSQSSKYGTRPTRGQLFQSVRIPVICHVGFQMCPKPTYLQPTTIMSTVYSSWWMMDDLQYLVRHPRLLAYYNFLHLSSA